MPSVLIRSYHEVVGAALEQVLALVGFHRVDEADGPADLAIVDLSRERPPFPLPPVGTPTIALVDASDDQLPALLRLGYRGYLRALDTTEQLLKAAASVLDGEVWAERKVIGRALDKLDHAHLTPRELEVLREIANGRSNLEIAERLGMAVKTVKAHASHLYSKLDVDNRIALSLKARSLSEDSDELD